MFGVIFVIVLILFFLITLWVVIQLAIETHLCAKIIMSGILRYRSRYGMQSN